MYRFIFITQRKVKEHDYSSNNLKVIEAKN